MCVPRLGKRGSGFPNADNLASRWFERGWTLQELIAPNNLVFYDKNWSEIGDRRSLVIEISSATSIYRGLLSRYDLSPRDNLQHLREQLSGVCIAAKMGWVSKRRTTEPEDIAYCLLGLFDVNLPLVYGEGGEKAFFRLQEQIISHSFDQTILTWKSRLARTTPRNKRWEWVLAPTPVFFADSEQTHILRVFSGSDDGSSHPHGLSFEAMICPLEVVANDDERYPEIVSLFPEETRLVRDSVEAIFDPPPLELSMAILRCCIDGNYTKRMGLLVSRDRSRSDSHYHRVDETSVYTISSRDTHIVLGKDSQESRLPQDCLHVFSSKCQTKDGPWKCQE